MLITAGKNEIHIYFTFLQELKTSNPFYQATIKLILVRLHWKLQKSESAGLLGLVAVPALVLVAVKGSLVKPKRLVESGENLGQASNID